MDGENHGKPTFKNGMIWGEKVPLFSETSLSIQQQRSGKPQQDKLKSKGLDLSDGSLPRRVMMSHQRKTQAT